MIGKKLAHYEITAELGAGGMGQVYRARDTKLGRDVALKLLPPDMAQDAARLERLSREARSVAALDHPGIVTVYGIEEADGVPFIAMQLAEGKTLDDVIPPQGMTLDRIFSVAIPLADAITAAHQAGVMHRDIKPGNIMVGDDGRVRVLDFGLAKWHADEPDETGATQVATKPITGEGQILGTVAYMSPEQAEGKAIDARSDIFSLGVVLYQMATGELPFKGDTQISVITSILRDTPPPVTGVKTSLPRHFGRIVRRCLEKETERRYQTAKDLRNDLELLKSEIDSGELTMVDAMEGSRGDAVGGPTEVATGSEGRDRPSTTGATPAGWGPGHLLAAAFATLVVGFIVGYAVRSSGPAATGPDATGESDWQARPLTLEAGLESFPSLTPDGEWLVYAGKYADNWDVYLRGVGGDNPINLTPNSPYDDMTPAASPDGRFVAFRSERDGGGIFVMGRTGESVRRVAEDGYNPSWANKSKRIVFATEGIESHPYARSSTSHLWVVDLRSGERQRLETGDAVQPAWSPNGTRIAYWGLQPASGQRDIWTVAADGGDPVPVTQDAPTDWNPTWSPDGRHLYFASDRAGGMTLWRIGIDESTGAVQGEPEPVTTGGTAWNVYPRVGRDGRRLVFSEALTRSNVYRIPLDEQGDIAGAPEALTSGSRVAYHPDISPDGQWLVFATGGGQREDIFVMRVDGSSLVRLTQDDAKDRGPRWSPDGNTIAFYSDRSGTYEIWRVRRDGSGLEQVTDRPEHSATFPTWLPDGRLSYSSLTGYPDDRLTVLDFVDGDPRDAALVELEGSARRFQGFAFSSDGKWLAGNLADEDGIKRGVGVLDVASGDLTPLTDFGIYPVWLPGDRRLAFLSRRGLYSVDVETGETVEFYDPAPDYVDSFFSITADGRYLVCTITHPESDIWMLERP